RGLRRLQPDPLERARGPRGRSRRGHRARHGDDGAGRDRRRRVGRRPGRRRRLRRALHPPDRRPRPRRGRARGQREDRRRRRGGRHGAGRPHRPRRRCHRARQGAGRGADPVSAAAADGRRATTAVLVVFALNGFLFANWVSRLPAVRDALDLTPGQMGLLLLIGSIGSLLALPAAGAFAQRAGTAATGRGSAGVAAGGFAVVIAGLLVGAVPLLAVGLLVAQVGIAGWDVAMNVEGGVVEHAISREIMPRFHAGFSIGTVAGAGVGAVAALLHVPVTVHLATVAVGVALGTVATTRGFLPHTGAPAAGGGRRRRLARAFGGWREPRTVLVGVMVLAFALTEGAANDWVALAVVDGFATSDAVGAVGFGVFVVAMTLMRLAGETLLARFGRVAVLRGTTVLALAGLLLFALSPWLWLAFAGA